MAHVTQMTEISDVGDSKKTSSFLCSYYKEFKELNARYNGIFFEFKVHDDICANITNAKKSGNGRALWGMECKNNKLLGVEFDCDVCFMRKNRGKYRKVHCKSGRLYLEIYMCKYFTLKMLTIGPKGIIIYLRFLVKLKT